MVEEFEIADKLLVHQDSSLFRVSLLLLLSLPPKGKKKIHLKPAVSATNVQSAHSANKWKKPKQTFLLLASFFLAVKF